MDDPARAAPTAAPRVMCREIEPADFRDLLDVFQKGFPERSRNHFVRALDRLTNHPTPQGFPKYGYVLLVDGAIRGAVLTIVSSMMVAGEQRVRMNVSSWYVDPEFRGYAAMMTSRLRAFKQITHLNISPAPHTQPMLAALGYQPFCTGRYFALAALSRRAPTARVRSVSPDVVSSEGLSPSEAELLRSHAAFGCISVVCEWKGERFPFVFVRTTVLWRGRRIPHAFLVYCRTFESYVQLAGPLGRFLLLRGLPLIQSDSNGPVAGLIGRYADWGPRFARGPHPPHLGDLSYTEWTIFDAD
jgi:hypothetical protein